MAEVSREDLRVKSSDEGPVLQIGDQLEVVMRTISEPDDETYISSAMDDMRTDVESGPDVGPWWNVWNGEDYHPLISVQPEVREIDD